MNERLDLLEKGVEPLSRSFASMADTICNGGVSQLAGVLELIFQGMVLFFLMLCASIATHWPRFLCRYTVKMVYYENKSCSFFIGLSGLPS